MPVGFPERNEIPSSFRSRGPMPENVEIVIIRCTLEKKTCSGSYYCTVNNCRILRKELADSFAESEIDS